MLLTSNDAQDVLHDKELPAPNGTGVRRPGEEDKRQTLVFLPWPQLAAPRDAQSINNNKLSSFLGGNQVLNRPNDHLHLQTGARGSEGERGHLLGVETQVLLSPKFLPLTTLFHRPRQQLGLGWQPLIQAT